jgi:hypothetical protein
MIYVKMLFGKYPAGWKLANLSLLLGCSNIRYNFGGEKL